MYEATVDSFNDPVMGSNPGAGGGAFAMGHQFANSSCWYDVPPVGQGHSLNRWCMREDQAIREARPDWSMTHGTDRHG